MLPNAMTSAKIPDHIPSRSLQEATDIRRSVAERLLPTRLHPYARLARLDRPIGTWLLLLPCLWGLALGLGQSDVGAGTILWFAALFALGSLVMRGAGCTYNDIVDRDFDGQVARTALRPIPSGEVSVRQALIFLVFQLLIGAIILLSLHPNAILVGLGSIPIVVAYPFAKRITHWPQAVLGLAFNWGALVGYASLTGEVSFAAVLLYAGGVAWTLGYDTIYAHQDKEDDAIIGVKSTALLFGANTKPWLVGFFGLMLCLLALAGVLAGVGPWFWLGVAAVAVHLGWQVITLRIDDPDDCLAKFRANRNAGFLVIGALFLGWL
jgi:4-hydroxybenzoate polyprenyltransferase